MPALLTESPAHLAQMLRRAELFTDWVQIDIMDGLFVPSRSITSQDIRGAATTLAWEAHLMVQQPENYIDDFHAAGARRIVIHYEAAGDDAGDIVEHITSLGMGAGIAINPETPVKSLDGRLLSRLQSVLFMAVHPGYYGAQFIPEVLQKISLFRTYCPDVSIGIDGGVKAGNILQVARSGAGEICVGSAVFSQPDPASAYHELIKLAQPGWDSL